jgi:hypothetical protein
MKHISAHFTAVLSLLMLIHAAAMMLPPLNHDVAAVLHWSQKLIAGQSLYRDMTDVNPPLIFWLSALPAAAAGITGLSAALCLKIFISVLCLLCLLLLRVCTAADGRFLLAAAFALLVLPQHSFGQREHLLAIFTLPYLFLSARRWDGLIPSLGQALSVAIWAAIGLCLKPHFLLLPILMEGGLLLHRPLRLMLKDATPWGMIGGGLVYAAAALLLTPAYFSDTLPAFSALYALDAAADWPRLLLNSEVLWVALPLLAAQAFIWRGNGGSLPKSLSLAAAGALLAGFLQGKGWDYHFLAARILLLLTLVTLALNLLPPRWRPLPTLALFLCGSLWFKPFALYNDWRASDDRQLAEFLSPHRGNGLILWFGTGIKPQFPTVTDLELTSLNWPMSYWPIPILYRNATGERLNPHAPDAMPPLEKDLWNRAADALLTKAPALIVITPPRREGGFMGRDFDWTGWLGQTEETAAALARYRRLTAPDGHIVWVRP